MPRLIPVASLIALVLMPPVFGQQNTARYLDPISITPPPIGTDASVKYDYDIVYVRAPRRDPSGKSKWAEVGDPRTMEAGADLMLLHPDGTEEVLPSMFSITIGEGDVYVHRMAGGGGWGDPLERDPARVTDDVLDGKVTPEAAREKYAWKG